MELEDVMLRHIVLCILLTTTIGCGHSADGLRVEWNEVPRSPASEPELLVEDDDGDPDTDVYALVIDSALPIENIVFMDPGDGRFILRELECTWQGHRCVGYLPYDARRSHYLTVSAYRHRCPDVRLYRNGLEIDVERMRLRSCAFSMEADPD